MQAHIHNVLQIVSNFDRNYHTYNRFEMCVDRCFELIFLTVRRPGCDALWSIQGKNNIQKQLISQNYTPGEKNIAINNSFVTIGICQ